MRAAGVRMKDAASLSWRAQLCGKLAWAFWHFLGEDGFSAIARRRQCRPSARTDASLRKLPHASKVETDAFAETSVRRLRGRALQ